MNTSVLNKDIVILAYQVTKSGNGKHLVQRIMCILVGLEIEAMLENLSSSQHSGDTARDLSEVI